jgi:hypothetical protein
MTKGILRDLFTPISLEISDEKPEDVFRYEPYGSNDIHTASYRIVTRARISEELKAYKIEAPDEADSLEKNHLLLGTYDDGKWVLFENYYLAIKLKNGNVISPTPTDVSERRGEFDSLKDLLLAMRAWEYGRQCAYLQDNPDVTLMPYMDHVVPSKNSPRDEIEAQFYEPNHWTAVAAAYGVNLPPLNMQEPNKAQTHEFR